MIRIIYFLFILSGCATTSQNDAVETIDAEKLIELQDNGVKVVDVRTAKEFAQGHIPGAINIDFYASDFVERMKTFKNDESIIIHCEVGGRSGKASKILEKESFSKIYDYTGGYKDWKMKGFEIER
ncbi:rhodanese-like domain-containing protein [Ekhidna sp.]